MGRQDTATPVSSPLDTQRPAPVDSVRSALPLSATTAVNQPLTTPASRPQADGDARTVARPGDDEERQHRIRLHAYHRYLARGGSPGAELDDWLEAEREEESRRQ